MPELIMLVLDDPDKTGDVLTAWLAVGVSGITLLDSTGLAHHLDKLGPRADVPLFPSLRNFLQPRETPHRTLLTTVPDGFDVEALVAATEAITGTLDEPETGILLVLPVRQAWGLRRRPV
jgi:hypothetical protein